MSGRRLWRVSRRPIQRSRSRRPSPTTRGSPHRVGNHLRVRTGPSWLLTCGARLPGLNPDSTRGKSVSTVARNLFDWLNFRHDTRQDTRGLPFGTIQGLPDPDKHCLRKVNRQRRCGWHGSADHASASSRANPRSKRPSGGITFTPCTLFRSARMISLRSRRLPARPLRASAHVACVRASPTARARRALRSPDTRRRARSRTAARSARPGGRADFKPAMNPLECC